MEFLTSLLMETSEYKNWGWNPATISAAMILFFTVTETGGFLKQGWHIWQEPEKEGESVSSTTFLYFFPFFLACGVFGWEQKSAVMVINVIVTSTALLPILVGLHKFKGFSEKEKEHAKLFALMPALELLTDQRDFWYLIFSFGAWYAFWKQLVELWEKGETGVLDRWLLASWLLSTSAWTVFSFTGDNLWFQISMVGAMPLVLAIVALWCWFWWKENRKPRR